MLLSEEHKKRLKELAGITLLKELMSDEQKQELLSKSGQRVSFDEDIMRKAIEQGRELGITYKSNNEKYEMPVTKYRIIHPATMGDNDKGETVIRVLHVAGQSESEARSRGLRSAEASDEWRLLKAENIKNMFFTGRFFDNLPGNYNPNDSHMRNIKASFNSREAREYQQSLEDEEDVQVNNKEDKGGVNPIQEKSKNANNFFKDR